jgi:aminomethyltransferase
MVPFAGYEMPVQYSDGITAEHKAVRTSAGLFDVSHMGEVEITGPQALDFVQYVTTNDVATLSPGQAQYSTLPRDEGTLLDDLLVYRFPDHYLLVVNASNREKDFAWLARHASAFDVQVTDRSDDTALLALQGPDAADILQRLTETDLGSIAYYRFAEGRVDGRPAIISRTGYTGEDGFEIFLKPEDAVPVWKRIVTGEPTRAVPAGLGARDSLRLEMGYALYGNDLDEFHTALESGLGWVTKLQKGEFVGREALQAQKASGIPRRLVGFRLLERGFPRAGYPIAAGSREIGSVTSGTLSPSLGIGIGMGYVPTELSRAGTHIDILIRGQPLPAEVVRPPFYSRGSIKR